MKVKLLYIYECRKTNNKKKEKEKEFVPNIKAKKHIILMYSIVKMIRTLSLSRIMYICNVYFIYIHIYIFVGSNNNNMLNIYNS